MSRLRDVVDQSGRRIRCHLKGERDVWAGKTLLLDLDKTLVRYRDSDTGPKLERVNEGARLILPALREAGATAAITTASNHAYADWIAQEARLGVDRIFTRGDMLYFRGDKIRYLPKNYGGVLRALGEGAPHANCVAIGDDISRDVPVEPQGMVAVIAGMEIAFSRVVAYLRTMLQLGGGSFAHGFDRLMDGTTSTPDDMRFIRCLDWRFGTGVRGAVRILRFNGQEGRTDTATEA